MAGEGSIGRLRHAHAVMLLTRGMPFWEIIIFDATEPSPSHLACRQVIVRLSLSPQPPSRTMSESKGRVLLAYSGGLGELHTSHCIRVSLTLPICRHIMYPCLVDRARI